MKDTLKGLAMVGLVVLVVIQLNNRVIDPMLTKALGK
jgi:hypothetical protein